VFVDFFIERPVFATVCALLIILGGAIAIPSLPVAQFPELAPPQVIVTSVYIGANAQTVESAVTTPLEQAINGVEGMKYITSSSGNDGTSQVTVTFDVTRNVDLAAVDVQNRVNQALGRLPSEVKNTGVIITKQASGFVLGAGAYAEGQYDSLFLSNYLDVYVKDAVKRVKGVCDVLVFGERKYAMRLWLDPAKMAQRGLTASNVLAALQEQNVQVAAGRVGEPPLPLGQAYQVSVRAIGRLTDASEFDNIILKTGTDGTNVRVKDVGRAELGAESYGTVLRYNGHEAVGLGVTQLPGANALDVDKAVKAELLRLSKSFPPGLHAAVAFDTTTVIGESIKDVLITLLQAIALVIVVIYLFLQDWRSTFIPAMTIPVSLVGTFIFVKAFGFSINTLTLFGITLATGLVVDDAIVVIENVERHIVEGITEPHNAASVAMKEVAGAVIATSLVLIAVFVPVALFPGTTGIMFRQFALTIAFSVAISAFNALTLTPALSAIFLGHHRERAQGAFFRAFNKGVAAGTNWYQNAVRGVLHWKAITALAFLATLGLTYWVYQSVPRSFIPEEDQGWFMVLVNAPQGASLEYTRDVSAKAEDVLQKMVPEAEGTFSMTGFSFAGSAPNRGIIFIALKPFDERKGEQHSAAAVINRLRGPLMGIPGAMLFPVNAPTVSGSSSLGGFQFEVQDPGGNSLQQLANTANQLSAAGNQSGVLAGLFTTFTANDPQYLVKIDREKAKSLHIPLNQITDALHVYMGSVYVNDFDFNNRAYRVYVQAEGRFRNTAKDINSYYVRSDTGKMISLDNVVRLEQTATPQVISHFNLFRSAEISGSAAPGRSSGQAIADMESLGKKFMPQGMRYEWSGLTLEELESGSKALILFALGLVFVYLTLAAQYESFVLPFIVLLAVPVALLGAIGALYLRGLQNDVYCQIGLVMLIGLSSKNAILIVEFAEQLRAQGKSIAEAAVEAARIRLRPILMTSFAFILGVVPLVLATGAGRAGRISVGTTVFGGMIAATTLNLLFIPLLYVIVRTIVPGGVRHHELEHGAKARS